MNKSDEGPKQNRDCVFKVEKSSRDYLIRKHKIPWKTSYLKLTTTGSISLHFFILSEIFFHKKFWRMLPRDLLNEKESTPRSGWTGLEWTKVFKVEAGSTEGYLGLCQLSLEVSCKNNPASRSFFVQLCLYKKDSSQLTFFCSKLALETLDKRCEIY